MPRAARSCPAPAPPPPLASTTGTGAAAAVASRLAPPPPSAAAPAPPPAASRPAARRWRPPPAPLALLLLAAVAAAGLLPAGGLAARPPITEGTDCHGVPAQSALDYEKMRGTWYVVEVAEHLPAQGPAKAPASTTSCPQMEVWPPSAPASDVRLRLRWREGNHHVNYELRLPEPDTHKGYWLVDQPQNGSLTTNDKYRQFEGAVMVMKATASHAVLTFCGNPGADRQVYSVVMAREPSLPAHDLASVNGMLVNRGLPQTGLKRTCKDFRNGGWAARAAAWPAVVAGALALAAAGRRCGAWL